MDEDAPGREECAAAYARISPDECREMWNRTVRAAAELELIPPWLQTNVCWHRGKVAMRARFAWRNTFRQRPVASFKMP